MFFLSNWQALANSQIVDNIIGKERSLIGNILNIVRIVGTGIALIMLAVMSISDFAANGRGMPFAAEKQADVKGRQLANFAIGVAVFIGASNILVFVADFVESVVKG